MLPGDVLVAVNNVMVAFSSPAEAAHLMNVGVAPPRLVFARHPFVHVKQRGDLIRLKRV